MNHPTIALQCEATTRSGNRCRNRKVPGSLFCTRHQVQTTPDAEPATENTDVAADITEGWEGAAYERDRNLSAAEISQEADAWPRGRDLTRAQIAEIMESHRIWRQSKGRDGQRGDLRYANLFMQNADSLWFPYGNLRGARFLGSSLRHAVFSNADLRGAVLSDTELQSATFADVDARGAYFRNAKLSEAYLHGANLRGAVMDGAILDSLQKTQDEIDAELADLRGWLDDDEEQPSIDEHWRPASVDGANFRDAVLSDAKLGEVTGLRPEMLAGADLTGAKLPSDIARFETLATVGEISKAASTAHLTMIGACFYSALTVATTQLSTLSDAGAVTKLPILGTDIPVTAFFVVAPIILFGVYVYLHMYLIRLWELLSTLPAWFPDGRALDEKAHPWMLISLVRLYVPLLRKHRKPLWWIQVGISITTAWMLVPLVILLFLIPLVRVGSALQSVFVGALFLSVIAVGIATMRLARDYLAGQAPPLSHGT